MRAVWLLLCKKRELLYGKQCQGDIMHGLHIAGGIASSNSLHQVVITLSHMGTSFTGGIDRLVALLSASSGKTREAAAMALYYMGMASPAFCSETFTSLCNTMLHARGEAAVLAALDLLYTGGASEGLAATYLTNVSVKMLS